jgi:hypothetical protein
VQYLAVAGGGGASNAGGGAGGVLQGLAQVTAGTTYTITVGSGGSGGISNYSGGSQGSNGVNSSISGTGLTTITAVGGGGGGAQGGTGNGNGLSGGSGGGEGYGRGSNSVGAGTTGQGYAGGLGYSDTSTYTAGGGGGGYGMLGYNVGTGNKNGGNGGDGYTTYIANPSTYSWSNYFNSTGYFSVPSSSNLTFGTNDFTIEFWIYTGSTSLEQPIGTAWNGTSGEWTLFVNQGSYPNKIAFFNYYSGGSNRVALVSTSNVNNNTWYHVAITRKYSTSTMYMFINGSLQATDTNANSGGLNFNSTESLSCGAYYYGGTYSNFLQGYISNLRIVNGTCLHTSSFTPSTTPLTAITNTQLLTCQSPTFSDNSSNNFTLTIGGSPYIASQNPFGASYAGGGGGSTNPSVGLQGYGGMGGGGLATGTGIGNAGATNTGAGGGGENTNSSSINGGAGGSGVVILAYPSTFPAASSVTGSPTVTTTSGYRVYTFTGTGSITF